MVWWWQEDNKRGIGTIPSQVKKEIKGMRGETASKRARDRRKAHRKMKLHFIAAPSFTVLHPLSAGLTNQNFLTWQRRKT